MYKSAIFKKNTNKNINTNLFCVLLGVFVIAPTNLMAAPPSGGIVQICYETADECCNSLKPDYCCQDTEATMIASCPDDCPKDSESGKCVCAKEAVKQREDITGYYRGTSCSADPVDKPKYCWKYALSQDDTKTCKQCIVIRPDEGQDIVLP